MKPKKYIGQISERNLLLCCAFIRELKPDEDLILYVNKGVITALKQENGERYKPMADNDFIESLFFLPSNDYPAVVKLTFSN